MTKKIYMQFNDIQGNRVGADHANWIELNSLDFSASRYVSQEAGVEKREIGNTAISSLHISKTIDKSSQKLLSEVFGGFGTDVCTIHFVIENKTYLEYVLRNAVLSSYNVIHSTDSYSMPSESFTINFTRIETKYIEENDSSSICAGYDIPTAKNL